MTAEDALLDELATRVAAHAGIWIAANQRWLLGSRVEARAAALGLSGPARYIQRVLDGDAAELERLVELLRVGETRFYRHPRQLQAIRRIALPELRAACEKERRPLRVWSAACATGEEAYTLALLLRQGDVERFEILATDLSEVALTHARAARYAELRCRDVPARLADAAFSHDGSEREVRPEYRAGVRFSRLNLVRDPFPQEMDLVLCRNVLLYFDTAVRARVLERLFSSVRQGGYVALGYADRVGEVEGLEAIRTPDGLLFRRTGIPSVRPPPMAPAPRPDLAAPRVPREAAPRAARPSLRGELSGESGRRAAHDALSVAMREDALLDLREVRFADDLVARELVRANEALAQQGRTLRIVATEPGVLHFLRRHQIVPPAVLVTGPKDRVTP